MLTLPRPLYHRPLCLLTRIMLPHRLRQRTTIRTATLEPALGQIFAVRRLVVVSQLRIDIRRGCSRVGRLRGETGMARDGGARSGILVGRESTS